MDDDSGAHPEPPSDRNPGTSRRDATSCRRRPSPRAPRGAASARPRPAAPTVGLLIRESVADYLADIEVEDDPLLELIGLALDSGPKPHGDVAAEHDAYIAESPDRAPTDTWAG